MGQVIYCETKETTTPYIFTNTRIAVYSYEEVCYYIFHNSLMLTQEDLGEPFIWWVRERLHMAPLAERLTKLREEQTPFSKYLKELLLAANYYSPSEVALLFERMKTEAELPKPMQLKKQADRFLEFHKCVRAIRIYDTILAMDDLEPEFRACVYHNKGVALAQNFELQAAAFCYEQAYRCDQNEVSLFAYLMTFFMRGEQDEAWDFAQRLGVDEDVYRRLLGDYLRSEKQYEQTEQCQELKTLLEDCNYGQNKRAQKRLHQMIQEWKEEYRNQTT